MQDLAKLETFAKLLAFEYEEFVEKAYVSLLGRPVDPDGRNHYLDRLRMGTSKLEILLELASSKEGQTHAPKSRRTTVREYRPRMPSHHRSKRGHPENPFLGIAEALHSLDDRIDARIENQQRQLAQVNSTLFELLRAISQLSLRPGNSPSEVTTVGSTTAIEPNHSALLEQLSPYAREIFEHLDSASTHLAGNNA